MRWRHARACYDVLELTSSGVGASDSFARIGPLVRYRETKVMLTSDFRLSCWPGMPGALMLIMRDIVL